MAWENYKNLDVKPEKATKEEIRKLHIKYATDNEKYETINKGARADAFKKRYSK